MRGRTDPYLRVLAAVALVSVVTGAVLDPSWLPLLAPAVAVLFAVGGAVAASAADTAASGRAFVGRALTTLLLPFWLFAAAAVATMLTLGWSAPIEGAEPFAWSTAWLWLLPVSAPPASLQGIPWMVTASFLPAYLWLTLATPVLLWLSRRWPLRLLAMPMLTVLVLTTGIATVTGRARDVLLETSVYGCCWLIGFARHDGRLFRLRGIAAVAAGAALLGSGLALFLWRQEAEAARTIAELPSAALLVALGVVVLLLRVPWRGDHLRSGWPGALLSTVGARTMTVFLWAPAAAAATAPALARSPFAQYLTGDASGFLLRYGTTWLLVLVVVLLVGWAEDAGAGRTPALLRTRRPAARPAAPERTFVVRDNLVQALPPAEPADRTAERSVPRPVGS